MARGKVALGAAVIAGLVAATLSASAWADGSAKRATLKVTLGTKAKEFALIVAPKAAKAGTVTFVVKNGGKVEHEFVVLKTNLKASKLPVVAGKAKESGKVGEIEEVAPGKTKKLTLTLKRGHYVLLCNVAGHYLGGQYADFTVT